MAPEKKVVCYEKEAMAEMLVLCRLLSGDGGGRYRKKVAVL